MIAFSAESASAMMSIPAISQFRTEPPLPPKIFPANVTKIVFGSTSDEFESALAPSTMMNAIGISV